MLTSALGRTRPAGEVAAAAESTTRRWDRLGPWLFWLALAAGGGWAVLAYPQYAVVGAIVGTLYALGALGLTLIYGIAKVPHFAHGALLGGLIVGVAAEVVIGAGAIKPDYKLAVAFALLIGVILVRPRGLFGVNGGRL